MAIAAPGVKTEPEGGPGGGGSRSWRSSLVTIEIPSLSATRVQEPIRKVAKRMWVKATTPTSTVLVSTVPGTEVGLSERISCCMAPGSQVVEAVHAQHREVDDRADEEEGGDQHIRAPDGMAFRIAVDEGQRQHQSGTDPHHDHDAEADQLGGEEDEKLVEGEVEPLRRGHVGQRGGVGGTVEGRPRDQRHDEDEDDQHQ